jgi:hypothetical protein
MNRTQIETRAAELGFSLHKGDTKFSGYLLIHDATGNKPLGNDYKSPLQDVARYLERAAHDIADIDSDEDTGDVKVESSGPRKDAPTKASLIEALEGHSNAEEIKSIPPVLFPDGGRDRSVSKRSSHTKQEDYRIKSLDNLLWVVCNPKSREAFNQLPKADQDRHWANLKAALEEDERINNAKHGITEKELTFADRERLEEQRRKRAFAQADYALNRTNIQSRFDYDDATSSDYRNRIGAELKELHNSPTPEPGIPDYSAPKAASTPNIVSVKRKLSRADIASRRAEERERGHVKRLEEIASALSGARKPDGRLLKEAKAILQQQGSGFYDWLEELGISQTTARRQMRAA